MNIHLNICKNLLDFNASGCEKPTFKPRFSSCLDGCITPTSKWLSGWLEEWEGEKCCRECAGSSSTHKLMHHHWLTECPKSTTSARVRLGFHTARGICRKWSSLGPDAHQLLHPCSTVQSQQSHNRNLPRLLFETLILSFFAALIQSRACSRRKLWGED